MLQCSCGSMARSCMCTPAWQFHQPSTHGGTRCSSPCTRSAHYLPPFAYRGARCSLPSHNHLRAALASPIPPSALPPRTLSSPIQAARIPAPAAFAAPSLRTSRSPQARSPPGPAAGRGGPARCPAPSRPVRPRPARRLGGRLGRTPLMAHSPSISASRSSPFPQLSAHGSATSRSPRIRSSSARRAGSCAEIRAQTGDV